MMTNNKPENFGIIYKITNLINGKIYIGKTKQYYGNSTKIKGINARFKRHIRDAKNNKNYCVNLCKAIRKYGEENFTIEEVLRCKLEELSDKEVQTIKHFNSTDKEIGYNISGGGVSLNCKVNDKTRQKISNTMNKKSSCDLNIAEIKRNNKIVGYRAQRKENGDYFYKSFGNTINTLEENYKLAQQWLEEFKSGAITEHYVKATGLPTTITYKRNNSEIIGYRVNIRINKKLHSKDFISNKLSMDEKLEQAIKFKESILSNNN